MKRAKEILTWIIILLVFCPIPIFFGSEVLAWGAKIVHRKLKGLEWLEKHPPSITISGFFSGEFQKGFEKWVNETFPLRKEYIRLSNQLYYTLFRKSYMYDQTIIIGKERQLYERPYADDYCNIVAPVDKSAMEEQVKAFSRLQILLKERGVRFLFLITPNKPSIYPEFIPDVFLARKKMDSPRNYDNLVSLLKKYDITYVDGHLITAREKEKTSTQLFCEGGTHWNDLGAFYTTRELVRKAGEVLGKKLPGPEIIRIDFDRNPTGNDKDLADLLHLLRTPKDYPVPHPVFAEAKSSYGNIAVIGGSFNFAFLNIMHKSKIFRSIDFYYYYKLKKQLYYSGEKLREMDVDTEKIDWEKDFFRKDLIVLEINEVYTSGEYYKVFVNAAISKLEEKK